MFTVLPVCASHGGEAGLESASRTCAGMTTPLLTTWRRPAELEAAELGEGHLGRVAVDLHLVVAPPSEAEQLRVPHPRAALW
jgi:hypothetical protein